MSKYDTFFHRTRLTSYNRERGWVSRSSATERGIPAYDALLDRHVSLYKPPGGLRSLSSTARSSVKRYSCTCVRNFVRSCTFFSPTNSSRGILPGTPSSATRPRTGSALSKSSKRAFARSFMTTPDTRSSLYAFLRNVLIFLIVFNLCVFFSSRDSAATNSAVLFDKSRARLEALWEVRVVILQTFWLL